MRRLLLLVAAACIGALALPAWAEPMTRLEMDSDVGEDLSTRVGEDRVRVVVEIPAGTDALWQLNDDGDAVVRQETEEGPRRVRHLPYPGSYGRLPQTLRPRGEGGDGGREWLGALLLAPALARGSIVEARPVGVLQLGEGGGEGGTGETHVLAVLPGTPLGEVRDLEDLEARFPGVASLVESWFRHARGDPERPGGLAGAAAAWERIDAWGEAWAEAEGD